MNHRNPLRSNGQPNSLGKGLELIWRAGDVSALFFGFPPRPEKAKETAGSHPPLAWNHPQTPSKDF